MIHQQRTKRKRSSNAGTDLVTEIAEYLRRCVLADLPEAFHTNDIEMEPIDLGEMKPDGIWMLMKASYAVLGWPTEYGEGVRYAAREAVNACQDELRKLTWGWPGAEAYTWSLHNSDMKDVNQ